MNWLDMKPWATAGKNSFVELFRCACHSPDHILIMSYYDWEDADNPDELTLHVHLKPRGLRKRLWVAIKYIFNRSGNDVHFEDIMVDVDTALNFRDALNRFIKIEQNKKIQINPSTIPAPAGHVAITNVSAD